MQRGQSEAGTTCRGINTIMEFIKEEKCWVYRNDILPSKEATMFAVEKYKNATNSATVLPYFILPEFGTTIILQDEESDDPICEFQWNDESFSISDKKSH